MNHRATNTMYNPPHPGEVLQKEILEPLGLDLTSAARLLKMKRDDLARLIAGRTGISGETARRLGTAFKPSAASWLRHQAAWDRRRDLDRE